MRKVSLGLTVLLALAILGSGISNLVGVKPIMEAYHRLKIPLHLATFLGAAKVSASIALLLTLWRPQFVRLREWVFAGLSFNMMGAIWWHVSAGDTVKQTMGPVVFLVLVVATWWLGAGLQDRADVEN